ncbi:O-antigen translocase [Ideonella sp. BN130291]|uniref:O-antigen translocase n=1 Tax=Ideonella sp. BN130291 TaxID=3112940 RepID=UPI002E27705E|nr:O-antigen translocase [Ideonella sp. BN130291]
MSLRKAASLGAVQTAVSVIAGFLSVKVTSVFLGPAGMGVLSQLQYFIAMSQTGVSAGLNTGVVRKTAEYGVGSPGQALVVSTVFRLLVWVGIPLALIMAIGSRWLAQRLLHNDALALPLLVFAAVYVLGLVAALIIGSATGAKDYKATASINIGTSLSTVALYTLLCPRFGVNGGLMGAALVPAMTLLIAMVFTCRAHWWPKRLLALPFSSQEARAIAAFIPMAAVGAIALPLVQILVRNDVAHTSGMAAVGLLQGVMRISDMYVGLATSVLGMYYLPRFSEIRVAADLRRELLRGLLILVPAVGAVSACLYLLRDLVIHVVLTEQFLPMRDLFGWQMIGNVFKVIAWLFGALLVAKSNPMALTVFEVATYVFWWLLARHFVAADGVRGATEAYAATYVAYSVVAAAGIAAVLRNMKREASGSRQE